MSTLLQYALTTTPFPLQASPAGGPATVASLTLVATNATGASVLLQDIAVRLAIGPGATALTPDAVGIVPVAPELEHWKLDETQRTTEYVEFFFVPLPGYAALGANRSLSFGFTGLAVNSVAGLTKVRITEGGADEDLERTLDLTKFPAGWGNTTFEAESAMVPYNGSPVLRWSGPAKGSYSIQFYTPGTGPVTVENLANSGRYPGPTDPALKLQQLTIFTLRVEEMIAGVTYHAQQQVVVQVVVPTPVISRFVVTPADIVIGQPVPRIQLEWETTNVSKLHLEGVGVVEGPEVAKGSRYVAPDTTRKYFAMGDGLTSYTGPAATAEAEVSFVQPIVVTNFLPWVFDDHRIVALGDVARALQVRNGLGFDQYPSDVCVELLGGVEVANLGVPTAGNRPGYAQVVGATYQSQPDQVGKMRIWEGHYDQKELRPIDGGVINVGACWGIRFPNGHYGLFWFAGGQQEADVEDPVFHVHHWTFQFNWIAYPPMYVESEAETVR